MVETKGLRKVAAIIAAILAALFLPYFLTSGLFGYQAANRFWESVGQVLLTVAAASVWLVDGFIAAWTNPAFVAGVIVGTGGGWLLGRAWPKSETNE